MCKTNRTSTQSSQKSGQGLIEYLIIVALVSVSAITIMGLVGGQLNVKFAQVAKSLGANGPSTTTHDKIVTESSTNSHDLGNFFREQKN